MNQEMNVDQFVGEVVRLAGVWAYMFGPFVIACVCLLMSVGTAAGLVSSIAMKVVVVVAALVLAPLTVVAMPLYDLSQGALMPFFFTYIVMPAIAFGVYKFRSHPLVEDYEPFPLALIRQIRSGEDEE